MKMKKFMALCLSLVAALGMTLGAAACGDNNDSSSSGTQNSVPEGMVKFEFTVKIDGALAANTMVILCNGENCTPYPTDANGYVTMTVEDKEGWYAHVAGYEGDAYKQYTFYADQEESNSYTFNLPAKN